jgi:hypothetical protein
MSFQHPELRKRSACSLSLPSFWHSQFCTRQAVIMIHMCLLLTAAPFRVLGKRKVVARMEFREEVPLSFSPTTPSRHLINPHGNGRCDHYKKSILRSKSRRVHIVLKYLDFGPLGIYIHIKYCSLSYPPPPSTHLPPTQVGCGWFGGRLWKVKLLFWFCAWIWDPGSSILDPRCGMREPGFRNVDPRS